MGFDQVYDLVGGRAAWTVLALPTEGQIGDRRRVSKYVLPVASVGVDATIGDLDDDADPHHPVAVLGDGGVLLGALQPSARQLDRTTPVERVMVSAPGTVRPDLRIEEVLAQLDKDGLGHVFVTTASGVLLGLISAGEVHV